MKTLNPVFGPHHDNEFETEIVYRDLEIAGGMNIEVKDWDRVGGNEKIGLANIPPSRVLELAKSGKPSSIQLEVPPGRKETHAGSIILAIRNTEDYAEIDLDPPIPLPPLDFRSSIAHPTNAPPPYNKEIVIQIMSCRDLIAGDSCGTSDPFVEILMGHNVLHRTRWIDKTLNPAYSVDHKNTYILKCSAKELWKNHGIELNVKDHDMGISALGMSDDELGYVRLLPEMLYKANGDYKELKLRPSRDPKMSQGARSAGFITVRIREAALGDKDKRAAAEAEAIAMDDEQGWDVRFSVVEENPKMVAAEEDSESTTTADSNDLFLEGDGDNSDDDVPTPSPSNQQKPEGKKAVRKSTMQYREKGPSFYERGSFQQGDMFQGEVDALKYYKQVTKVGDAEEPEDEVVLKENTVGRLTELLDEKDERLRFLEMENENLWEDNKTMRRILKKYQYSFKTKKPRKEKECSKIPLAGKKHKSKSKEKKAESNSNSGSEAPKAEELTVPRLSEEPRTKPGKKKKSKRIIKKGKSKKRKSKTSKISSSLTPTATKCRPSPRTSKRSSEAVGKEKFNIPLRAHGIFDPSVLGSTDDDEPEPCRNFLARLGASDSVIMNHSLYSFVLERPEEEEKEEEKQCAEEPNHLPDFDRKHKDMEFSKIDFVGVANKIDQLPPQAINGSTTLQIPADKPGNQTEMLGVTLDQDSKAWPGKSPGRPSALNVEVGSMGDHSEPTTSTMLTGSTQTPTIAVRILEQEVMELKEELELAFSNPGGYEKATTDLQLKLAKDSNEKLKEEIDRLQKFNRFQTQAMMRLTQQKRWTFLGL